MTQQQQHNIGEKALLTSTSSPTPKNPTIAAPMQNNLLTWIASLKLGNQEPTLIKALAALEIDSMGGLQFSGSNNGFDVADLVAHAFSRVYATAFFNECKPL